MVFQLICWWVSYIFVLASSSWTCEEDLSEVPYFVLNSCQFDCAILCGLVPVCGSAIVQRSSRSPQGFGASLPVAWSHPTLAGIKLFTRCSQQSYPCSWTYYREDQAILVLNHIGTYHVVIRAIIVTVGLFIIHLSIICLPSITVFIHHIYIFVLPYPIVHRKAIQKKSYSLLLVLIILCCLHSSCCLLVTIVVLPPYSC